MSKSSPQEVGKRLKLLRTSLGIPQDVMAEGCGVPTMVWTQWEQGARRLSVENALEIKRRCSVSLDWIYEGDETAVAASILEALKRIEE